MATLSDHSRLAPGFSLLLGLVRLLHGLVFCFLLVPSFLAMSRSGSFFLLQVSSVSRFSGPFCSFCFGSSSFFLFQALSALRFSVLSVRFPLGPVRSSFRSWFVLG